MLGTIRQPTIASPPVPPTILNVVGNRPQFVKAAPVELALAGRANVLTVDSGQHYDRELAGVFYDELGLSAPRYRLDVGSGSHAVMTARILERMEPVILETDPSWVLVYGDTNTTLGAALTAAKLQVRVAHVEAGLRSFNRSMPEELNRLAVDAIADCLFAPSARAIENLASEGRAAAAHLVGDVMVDAARIFGPLADRDPVTPAGAGPYVLATVHREANTRPEALSRIVGSLRRIERPVVLPLHPRTRAVIEREGIDTTGLTITAPLGYLRFTALLRAASVLVTDSGGAQKEAYLPGTPCITLRDETEWVETVDLGWNRLVGTDAALLARALDAPSPTTARPPVYGDGHASERIAAILLASA